MRIYLIRHGIKEKLPGDPPLSELGKKQAKNTARHLKKYEIDKIESSPLKRTQETAKIIGQALGISYTVNDLLRERMNWGDAADQSFEDFVKEWQTASDNRNFIPISGDSSKKAGERLESVITSNFNENSKYKGVILVCHGGIIMDFLRNTFSDEQLNKTHDKFSTLRDGVIKECSISIIDFDGKNYSLESLATIDHLEAEN